jgi:hypothetical protein
MSIRTPAPDAALEERTREHALLLVVLKSTWNMSPTPAARSGHLETHVRSDEPSLATLSELLGGSKPAGSAVAPFVHISLISFVTSGTVEYYSPAHNRLIGRSIIEEEKKKKNGNVKRHLEWELCT